MSKVKEIKKVKYESYLTGNTHVHVQDGNRKVGKGIYTINLLAGDTPLTKLDGTQLTNIPGTCGGCCDKCKGDCYAIRTQIFRNNNIPSWADNTILATQETETFFKEIQQFIDRKYFPLTLNSLDVNPLIFHHINPSIYFLICLFPTSCL